MACYEYKLLHFKAGLATESSLPDDLNLRFDQLGKEGWEYVEMKPIQSSGLFFVFIAVFSRTKSFVAIFRRVKPN